MLCLGHGDGSGQRQVLRRGHATCVHARDVGASGRHDHVRGIGQRIRAGHCVATNFNGRRVGDITGDVHAQLGRIDGYVVGGNRRHAVGLDCRRCRHHATGHDAHAVRTARCRDGQGFVLCLGHGDGSGQRQVLRRGHATCVHSRDVGASGRHDHIRRIGQRIRAGHGVATNRHGRGSVDATGDVHAQF